MIAPDVIVPDPKNPQSLNRYSYVFNNPVNLVDPSGRTPEWCSDPAQADDASCSPANQVYWDGWYFVEGFGFIDMAHMQRGYTLGMEILTEVLFAVANGGNVVDLKWEKEFGTFEREYWVSGESSIDDVVGIALGIYMDFEHGFEAFQSYGVDGLPISELLTYAGNKISSYGAEDLPSDYLGFIAAVRQSSPADLLNFVRSNLGTPQQAHFPPIIPGFYPEAGGGTGFGFPRNTEFLPMVSHNIGSTPVYYNVVWPEGLQVAPIEWGWQRYQTLQ